MTKKRPPSESRKKPARKDEKVDPEPLPGWPGYRTRDGRSGYDPIDTRTEVAHVSGTFIRGLFTGNLKITRPLYLFLSGVLGLLLVFLVLIAASELIQGNLFSWEAGLTLFVAGLFGLALLTNLVKNLIRGRQQ